MRLRKYLFAGLAGTSLALAGAGVAVVAKPTEAGVPPPPATAAAPSPELIARGEYIARLGDCVACHTAPGGQPMAGGLELKTPFGALYSTNITPDARTGIGNYSFEQFDRAVRRGVAADGHNLYSAMPYPSYARIAEEDMHALYAYLTKGLAPVEKENRPSAMKWPFSMRWGLSLWNWAFFDGKPFQPDPARDAAWNRGAYLVQGLGHCGACHTPRGFAFQEQSISHEGGNGRSYLAERRSNPGAPRACGTSGRFPTRCRCSRRARTATVRWPGTWWR